MSGLDIPLWKQELLRRKQAKLTQENSVSIQKSNESISKARVSNNANSNSTVLNHRLTDLEKKADFGAGKKNALDKNNSDRLHNTKKGSMNNRNIILDECVDSSHTRLTSGNSNSKILDTGPNRLDNFEVKPSRNTSTYNKNFSVSGSCNVRGMYQNNRVPHDNVEKSNKIVDDSHKDRLNSPTVEQGVESEHISPRDVKKMWQRQATKDETLPKAHVAKKLSSTKENSKSQHSSNKEIPNRLSTQVGSNPPSVPKAYKSPYAKNQWHRPASVTDEKSVQNSTVSQGVKKSDEKHHAAKSSLHNGGMGNDDERKKEGDGVEHIQSVKSLLGLFGGKTKPNFNRKVSDNILLGNKTEKGRDYRTSEIRTMSGKRPGLYKHHSEPNLFFKVEDGLANDVPKKSPTSPIKSSISPRKSPTAESHHVSRGIKERMTRLRRASHSNMEEMDGFIEYQNRLNCDSETAHVVKNNEPQHGQLNQRQSPRKKDAPEKISVSLIENNKQPTIPKQGTQVNTIVHEQDFRPDSYKHSNVKVSASNQNQNGLFNSVTNATQKDTAPEIHSKLDSSVPAIGKISVSKQNKDYLHNNVKKTMAQSDDEKPRLSTTLNNANNRLSSPASNPPNSFENRGNIIINNTANSTSETKNELHDQSLSEQSSDKFLPAFGLANTKKMAAGRHLTDTNEHKSKNKYQSKQNNYVVETNQSDPGSDNGVVSTECLTEINQNKQDLKQVIKNKETVEEIKVKPEKKPRRKGLNVVDPLAVLQLTKDPILVKEKPPEAELGILKESPTGKVKIIKHEPDKKNQIAQINRAWDLDNSKPTLKQNDLGHKSMPASSIHTSPPTPNNVPVTSIDEIPVSVIDDSTSDKLNKSKSNLNSSGVEVGNTTSYNGEADIASPESDEEFIPVSSIDDEVDLGRPPEIVFDKMPGNLKSCFGQNAKVLYIFVIFLLHCKTAFKQTQVYLLFCLHAETSIISCW